MIVAGVDPGLATTGWAILAQDSGRTSVRAYGAIRTKPSTPLAQRLWVIHLSLTKIFAQYQPVFLAVEQLFFMKEAQSLASLAQARGVVLLAAQEGGLLIQEYNPRLVKMAVTGYGGADKMQIQKMLVTLLSLKAIPTPDDAADAMAIALCHLHTAGLGTRGSGLESRTTDHGSLKIVR